MNDDFHNKNIPIQGFSVQIIDEHQKLSLVYPFLMDTNVDKINISKSISIHLFISHIENSSSCISIKHHITKIIF